MFLCVLNESEREPLRRWNGNQLDGIWEERKRKKIYTVFVREVKKIQGAKDKS